MNDLREQASESVSFSEEVRHFYDQYPYPRPIDSLENYRQLWLDPQRRRAEYHLFWPSRPYREDQSILIAGCGTSQAAKHAMRWPAAQVTGIDVSATSVRYTKNLKQKYSLNNLQIYQLPIERVSDLDTSFDQIVCTGVLHHLEDPDAGLRALRGMLEPDGAMHLMMYAPYGRTGVYMLQDFCRRTGIHATDGDIRDLIAALGALPPGHPLENLLREAPDFRHDGALADALLHPKDRAYSVPQLFDFLERSQLAFGRWLKQAPYSPRCGVMAKIPQASRISHLPAAEQYAAAELFRGTMVRHSMIVYRDDGPRVRRFINFVDDSWPGYVPIRLPDTICVRQRLPAHAAGVLINQSHSYRDLVLPINEIQEQWFHAIDGQRCIGQIIESASPSAARTSKLDFARTFFERLWWYDQVVFDASR
jgi:2-polyprenyl-3-methyl-5-hydroxy-6-metoxy-1,4-benzoquinol methylase